MTTGYRVLVVEDDAFTRSTLAAAIRAHGLDVVAEASSSAQALRAAGGTSRGASAIDLAVIDVDLGPGPTGVDLAVALRDRDPSVGIVFLTAFDDPRLLAPDLPALPVGSVYLRKRHVATIDEVLSAMDRAVRGPGRPLTRSGVRTHDLTPAQLDLLRSIYRGMTNAQIAESLGQSVSAVEKSIRRLTIALGIANTEGNPRALLIRSYLNMTGRDAGP